jgi:hypothetical protein
MPDTPLVTYLKIQRAADREILAALRSSAANVSSELKRLQNATKTGEKVRREQLLRSQAAINREMAVLFDRVGDTVQAGAARAAEAGARTILEANKDLLREVLSASDYDYLVRSAEQSASNSLEALRQRVSGSSYVPLSQQVYDTQQLASGKIDEIVNAAIARGASAAELARDVRAYINPNTPGGVRYASLRLGRTELNNAFHAAQIKQAQEEPWTYGLRWNLSGSHPKPDECNEYADQVHYKDGEAGVFRPEEVPAKPHPNCLCYTTPEVPDPDEFIDQYMAGKYDEGIEESYPDVVEHLPMSTPEAVRAYAWGRSPDDGNLMFARLNESQRAGRELTDYEKKVRDGLDKSFEVTDGFTTNRRLYRQLDDEDSRKQILAHEGKVWTDKSFVSTSSDRDVAIDFDVSGDGVLLNIHAPKGTKAIDVDKYTEDLAFKQKEWLLPRDTRFFVRKVTRTDEGWQADVEILLPGQKVPASLKAASKTVSEQIADLERKIASEIARGKKTTQAPVRQAAKANIRKYQEEIRILKSRRKP